MINSIYVAKSRIDVPINKNDLSGLNMLLKSNYKIYRKSHLSEGEKTRIQ
jgi:hypothetical protein